MSDDFEVKTGKTAHGHGVTVKQTGNVHWDPMFGPSIDAVELTPFEAEKLADDIRKAAAAARANIQKSKYNIP